MAWSGMLPDTLPPWMYHAQLPPPKHIFDDQVFGITWVDLVFPFFLFSMGTAIPLALTNRLEKGQKSLALCGTLFLRGLLLALFAIYGEHLRPYEWSSTPDRSAWWVALGGWVLLLMMFLRWPKFVPVWLGRSLTAVGWIGATVLIAGHVFPDHVKGFENTRNDVILMVLANVAVSGGILWLFTRCRPAWRMVAGAAVGLVFLTYTIPHSMGEEIWNFTPLNYVNWRSWADHQLVPVFYHFEYHKYLLIVLAGTFCGDFVLRAREAREAEGVWAAWRPFGILVFSFAAPVLACWGMLERQTVLVGWGLLGIGVALVLLSAKAASAVEVLIMRLVRYGLALTLLGCLAEPIGGGIRKDEPTFSYFLLTAGLAFWVIAGLEVIYDLAKKGRWLGLLTGTGMNPILGYITITNLVMPLDGLLNYTTWIGGTTAGQSDWTMAFLSGGLKTLLVGVVASLFTKARLFLRT
jgi:predicted acyltransferase